MVNRGFTLIELLVVIAIIGLLSSIVLASLNTARGKGRDVRRLADMHTLEVALELYANDHNGNYPDSNFSGCGGWEATGSDPAGNFVAALTAAGVLPTGLKDPLSSLESSCGNYAYYRYPAGSNGCPVSRGNFYVLGARVTDAAGTARHPSSPGWSCPTRDWQVEFSWVTGGFEQ